MSTTYSTALAAKLAAVGDRTAYNNHIITDLGSSRTVTFKHAASGNPWSGTTFFSAPLTGVMAQAGGIITSLGTVGAHTVRANAVLSSGGAVMRIEGGGAWIQGTVGLAGATGFDGQPVDFVLRKSPNGVYSIVLNSAKFAAPLSLPLSPEVELHRRVLTNETSGAQASGFATQSFGEFFEQGEVPAGTYPQWRTVTGNLLCPSTVYNHVRWPDGSLRWCGVILVVPQVVPAGGTIEIAVKSGGDAPVASSRTLADAAGHNINLLVSGVTGLAGDWTAALNTGATTPENVVKLADGAAGAIWRVQEDFQQAGAPHGQLICWHYVQVLQNAAGAHAGTRYLGRVALPWADVASPAPVGMAVTCALRSGATVRRQLQGMNASSVLGATILLPHYGSIATCGTDAMYDFFAGAQSAECVVRVKPAGKKAARCRLVLPYDFSITPTARALVNQDSTARDYVGHGKGTMIYNMNNTGERSEIGVIPLWAAAYIVGDATNAERETRVNAMVTTGWVSGARRKSTGTVVCTTNTLATYAGLGPNAPTARWGYTNAGSFNFAIPTANTKLWTGEIDMHHRGGPVYPAYLFTAEPQYIDLMTEQSANLLSILPQGAGTTWNTTDPMTTAYTGAFHSRDQLIDGVSYPGAGLLFRDDLQRYAAWGLRDVGQMAAIYPDVCPYGTEVRQYLRDVLEANCAAWVAYKNLMSQAYRDNGMMSLKPSNKPHDEPWCMGYLANSYAHIYGLTGNASVLACANHTANYFKSLKAQTDLDFAAVGAYTVTVWDEDLTRINSLTRPFFQMNTTSVAYNMDTDTLTFNRGDFGYANGDVLRCPDTGYVAGAIKGTKLYVVNKSGTSFQVALTPGGAPADILKTETYGGPHMRIQNFLPGVEFAQEQSASSYIANINAAMKHMTVAGVTGLSAAIADLEGKLTLKDIQAQYPSNPKNALSVSLPTGA